MNDLENLKQLIAIPSNLNCNQILEFIKTKLQSEVCEIEVYPNKCLLAGINTPLNNINPIILSGHIDTVSPNLDLYVTNPYTLTEINGKAYGLGIIDMKCFTASVLDNLTQLKQLKSPIVFCLTCDEETSIKNIEFVIQLFKQKNIMPVFSIIGEPTNLKINNISKSCYDFKIEIFGKSCHSSLINQGINAIYIASNISLYIESLASNYPDTTMNIGVIKGGDIVNRVPDYCELHFDIRTTSINIYENILNKIEIKLNELKNKYKGSNINMTKIINIPPLTCKNNKKIKNLALNLNLEIDTFKAGCEAGFFEAFSGDAIIFGVGDLNLAHKPNEYMIIESYFKYNTKLLELLKLLDT